ncbi:MAG: response regulator [Magnetococcales bacterium]|nr:response regulator [Magnetococcales bacterium]
MKRENPDPPDNQSLSAQTLASPGAEFTAGVEDSTGTHRIGSEPPLDPPGKPSHSNILADYRILLVEDDPMLMESYKILVRFLGGDFVFATDFETAMSRFLERSDPFDLIIIDQGLPSGSGVELAKKMLGIRPDTPILLWSGHCSDKLCLQARQAGIARCIEKPFIRADFVREIETSLLAARKLKG